MQGGKINVPPLESFGILALLSVLIAAPAFLIIRLLEPGFVPPAFSILLFSEAAIAGIVARATHIRGNPENVTLWGIAGAFTMMGCAAAMPSEPDQVVRFFEQLSNSIRIRRCRRQSPGRAPLAASRLRCRTGVRLEWPRFDIRRRIAARISEPNTYALPKKLASKRGSFFRQERERDPCLNFSPQMP